jgi:hypothetical protein
MAAAAAAAKSQAAKSASAPTAPTPVAPTRRPHPKGPKGGSGDSDQLAQLLQSVGAELSQVGKGMEQPGAGQGGVRSSITVSVSGTNIRCRRYPDNFIADANKLAHFSAPAKLDVVCWTPASPNTVGPRAPPNPYLIGNPIAALFIGPDRGYLRTKTGCYIAVAEVVEKRTDYSRILNKCTLAPGATHWVGTLQPQYSRKDCYSCAKLSCKSEELGSVPFVDLGCITVGEDVRGNTTWYKNKDLNCYFPAGVFEPTGYAGKLVSILFYCFNANVVQARQVINAEGRQIFCNNTDQTLKKTRSPC